MKKLFLLLLAASVALPVAAKSVTHSKSSSLNSTGVKLTLTDPSGSVYNEGEPVRFTVQTDADAYVVVFDIDTEGFAHLLYPTDAKSLQRFEAGRSYELPESSPDAFLVAGKTGMEFVFAVAVRTRNAINDREISFLLENERLSESRKFRIDGDPFLAANRIANQLVRGIAYADDVSLAFTYFYVNEAVDYPRYLCETCYEEGKDPYSSDNEYVATSAFNREDHLGYPLQRGFERSHGEVAEDDDDDYETGGDGNEGRTTNVHVYRYYDNWYPYGGWSYYGYPYYGSGFYFSIGWNWRWGYRGFGWSYPYYYGYCAPYYYGGSYYHGRHHYGLTYRTFRPLGKYRYKGTRGAYATLANPSTRLKSTSIRHERTNRLASAKTRSGHAYRDFRNKSRPVHKVSIRKPIRQQRRSWGQQKDTRIRDRSKRAKRPHIGKPSTHKRAIRSTKPVRSRKSYDVRPRSSRRSHVTTPKRRAPSQRVTPRVKSSRGRSTNTRPSVDRTRSTRSTKKSTASRSSSRRGGSSSKGGRRK
ncbi:MAG: DUF4384 domain-containing protein [Candidatus Krumholzibacteria bacterium]|nr:DUF4384 domain-containing protein [Candidatus Krumholzibacteria bacterium]